MQRQTTRKKQHFQAPTTQKSDRNQFIALLQNDVLNSI